MTIADAIHKAATAGYHLPPEAERCPADQGPVAAMFLEPAFWQALAEALDGEGQYPHGDWKILWHDFIEHLIEGGTAKSFFARMATSALPMRLG